MFSKRFRLNLTAFSNLIQKNVIQLSNLGRLKIRKENILSMKFRVSDINLKVAEHFDSFPSVIFNCKIKYCSLFKAKKSKLSCTCLSTD